MTLADAPLYLRHLDDARRALGALAQHVVDELAERLRQSGVAMVLSDDRSQLHALMDALQRRRPALVQALAEAMHTHIDQAQHGHSPRRALQGASLDELRLVDDEQVDTDIEVARLMAVVDERAQLPLRELHAFTAALRQDARLPRDANPLRPAVFAMALLQSLNGLGLPERSRALVLQHGAAALADALLGFYAEANDRLRAAGLSPHATGRSGAVRAAVQASSVDVTRPGALYGLLDRLTAHPAVHVQAASAGLTLRLQDPARPSEPPLRPASGLPPQRVRDLLRLLFAQIVADPKLPPALTALLGQLEPTLERLALTDPQFLYTDQHPAWQFLNRVASQAAGFAEPGDHRAQALLDFLATPIQRMRTVGNPDGALFGAALVRLNQFLAQLTQHELQHAAPSLARLQGAERRGELLPLMREQLAHQLSQPGAPDALTDALRLFITSTWALVLAHSMAQEGPDSPAAQAYTAAVDELLWSLQPARDDARRAELRARLPALVRCLQQGMAAIDWPDTRQQHVLDELMTVHSALLRGKTPGRRSRRELAGASSGDLATTTAAPSATQAGAPADSHAALHALLQQGDEQAAAGQAGAQAWQSTDFGSADTGVGGLPTVPMALPGDGSGASAQGDPWLSQLRPGTWCKLFLRGRWTTAQLLWRSDKDQFCLFTSPPPGPPQALTRRALARLRAEGLATALEERSLVQRAVDGMVLELSGGSPALR